MAGSRIKGITVEIGGDTTKLQSALKGVNAEIKNTQSQLKDVEKLLNLDSGNTELLAQKQKLLSSAVSETKEKLATLKTVAVIDETDASQVRNLYKNYLSGLSLTKATKEAGLDLLHSGAKRMMLNRHYLGDDFYPAIIDPASFDAVSAELSKRSAQLGRNDRYIVPIIKRPPTAFRLGDITENYENPVRQAEYLYSLIESEVK